HHAGHEGGLRLWLSVAAHRAVDEAWPVADEVHRRDQGRRRALARREPIGMPGVEREARAAVLEQHAGVPGDDAGPELVVEALDDADGVVLRVGGDDRDRVATGARALDRSRAAAGG